MLAISNWDWMGPGRRHQLPIVLDTVTKGTYPFFCEFKVHSHPSLLRKNWVCKSAQATLKTMICFLILWEFHSFTQWCWPHLSPIPSHNSSQIHVRPLPHFLPLCCCFSVVVTHWTHFRLPINSIGMRPSTVKFNLPGTISLKKTYCLGEAMRKWLLSYGSHLWVPQSCHVQKMLFCL